MSTTIKTGWLKDNNGEKFAPKTLTSQVQTSDGILLEDKIQADLDAAKEDILSNVSNSSHDHDDRYYTETEIDTKLSAKSDTSHTHNNYTPTSRTVNGKALSDDITLSASDVGADASGSASSALSSAKTYTDNAVAQKTQVQFITWEADD